MWRSRGRTWLSCRLSDNRCWRHDDGTLLRRRNLAGVLEPIPPDVPEIPPDLEILNPPTTIQTTDGKLATVKLRVRNNGTHRAFWLRTHQIRPTRPLDLALTPGIPSPTIVLPSLTLLDPGEEADLDLRISVHAPLDPQAGELPTPLLLELTALHLAKPIRLPPIRIEHNVPSLTWQGAERSGNTISVRLVQSGTLPLLGARVTAALSENGKPLDIELATQDLAAEIAPGTGIPFAFALPEGFDLPPNARLRVEVRQTVAPIHVWTFDNKAIRPPLASSVLALGVLALGIGILLLPKLHPRVRALVAAPETLRDIPIDTLGAAHRALAMTHRLRPVLEGAGIPAETYAAALRFARLDSALRAAQVAERLGGVAVKPLDVGNGDARDLWTLPLGASFPLNVRECILHLPSPKTPAAQLLTRLRAHAETRDEIVLILSTDPRQRRLLHAEAVDRGNRLVAATGPQITRFLLADNPPETLARVFAEQLARKRLSPYISGGGVNDAKLFTGREKILADIINRAPINYLVVGGRQLGKTSLLKELERRYADDPLVDCHYFSLSSDNLTERLAKELDLPRAASPAAVLERLADLPRGHRRLLLVDEVDTFVADPRRAKPQLDALRNLSEEGRCHFVLAGFWNLYHAVAFDYQSPLRNFGEVVRIGALEPGACRELAVEPMETLGLAWEDIALVKRLLERTGRRANLISVVCNEILEQLDDTARTIPAALLDAAFDADAVDVALGGWTSLSGEPDEDRLDQLIIYATVGGDGFTQAEILERLAKHGVRVPGDRLERSLRRLELAYILGRERRGPYRYRVPLFVERLREQPLDVLLETEVEGWKRPDGKVES